jgi:hypothetical protein
MQPERRRDLTSQFSSLKFTLNLIEDFVSKYPEDELTKNISGEYLEEIPS